MKQQSIAAAVSESHREDSQLNRSGPNFEFLKVPASGNITVNFLATPNPSNVEAVLVHEKGGDLDIVVAPLVEGGTFSADKVKANGDYKYYIAGPNHAQSNFAVVFKGDV